MFSNWDDLLNEALDDQIGLVRLNHPIKTTLVRQKSTKSNTDTYEYRLKIGFPKARGYSPYNAYNPFYIFEPIPGNLILNEPFTGSMKGMSLSRVFTIESIRKQAYKIALDSKMEPGDFIAVRLSQIPEGDIEPIARKNIHILSSNGKFKITNLYITMDRVETIDPSELDAEDFG